MKKHLLLALFMVVCIGSGSFAHAADTFTVKKGKEWRIGDIIKREVIVTWLDDGGDGVSDTLDFTQGDLNMEGWILYSCETDPGSPAPTASYDIVFTDKWGVDKMGGGLLNRHTSTSEEAFPVLGYPVVNGPNWTFTLSGNSQAGATGVVSCIFFSN